MNLMPYRYTCSICGQEFRADNEEEAFLKAQNHIDRSHDESIEREEIERNIQEE